MREIDAVIQQLQLAHPKIRAEQLAVTHRGADDDGLWFFTHPTSDIEMQLESSTGNSPFLVEISGSAARSVASSVQQAIAMVAAGLGLSGPVV